MEPYHKYVFDVDHRKFVGKFEEMYQQEDKENFDSWYQDDMNHLSNQISLVLLRKYNFNSILDLGCGKGTFTSLLKKENNQVEGWDISPTAVEKAKNRFKQITFETADIKSLKEIPYNYDLIVIKEVLSYLDNWRDLLKIITKNTSYLFISLFLPENPIGFVKSFNDLKAEVKKSFEIKEEVFIANSHLILLAKKIN